MMDSRSLQSNRRWYWNNLASWFDTSLLSQRCYLCLSQQSLFSGLRYGELCLVLCGAELLGLWVQIIQCMEDQGEQEEAIALEHIIAQQRNALAEAKVVGLILPFLFFLSSLRSIFCESLLVSGYKWWSLECELWRMGAAVRINVFWILLQWKGFSLPSLH